MPHSPHRRHKKDNLRDTIERKNYVQHFTAKRTDTNFKDNESKKITQVLLFYKLYRTQKGEILITFDKKKNVLCVTRSCIYKILLCIHTNECQRLNVKKNVIDKKLI